MSILKYDIILFVTILKQFYKITKILTSIYENTF